MQAQNTPLRRLVELTPDECWQLAGSCPVGRLAWTTTHGPMVIPVNFTVAGDVVHIRTAAYSQAARECDDSLVAFEVDTFDEHEQSGWSVLMRGHAHLAFHEAHTELDPEPWVGETRRLGLRVEVAEITGRRIQG